MGLNFFKWLTDTVTGNKEKKKVDLKAVCMNLTAEIYLRELAFHMITNKIGNALSKCELNVYYGGKREKGETWYRWNIQPNVNQNATQFWNKLVDVLFNENEALIVMTKSGELFIADSYNLNDSSAMHENYFDGVTVNDFVFDKRFYMHEVYYFKLNNKDLRLFLDGTLQLYKKLINASYSNYLVSNGNKGILKIEQFNEQQDGFEDELNEILNEDFRKFFENANAVIPLYEGYEYQKINGSGKSDSRDFNNLVTDVINLTANAFNVPQSIANGSVQDTSKAIDEFLTFCLDPLIELLTDEITRKNFTMAQVIGGYFVKFDTKAVKHIDLLDVATSIDKLISSGCFTINGIRRVCGEDEIDEPWANQFFMTKNYSAIEDLVNPLKGGDET